MQQYHSQQQCGASLLELSCVIAIAASFLITSSITWQKYQEMKNIVIIRHALTVLTQAMSNYYYAHDDDLKTTITTQYLMDKHYIAAHDQPGINNPIGNSYSLSFKKNIDRNNEYWTVISVKLTKHKNNLVYYAKKLYASSFDAKTATLSWTFRPRFEENRLVDLGLWQYKQHEFKD